MDGDRVRHARVELDTHDGERSKSELQYERGRASFPGTARIGAGTAACAAPRRAPRECRALARRSLCEGKITVRLSMFRASPPRRSVCKRSPWNLGLTSKNVLG